MEAISVDQLAQNVILNMNEQLSRKMQGDCVFIHCGMHPPLDDEFRVVIEDIKESKDSNSEFDDHLVIVLETTGGYMETVERLVSVMREHYGIVSFVIPNFAFSAGTVLALSGDEIYMDYYSVLGPIDPQYQDSESGQMLPGAGYLAKFNELIKRINSGESSNVDAELAFLVENFDPARLFHIEQGINHGRTLIKEWLPRYKFKNWLRTEVGDIEVTEDMKERRAIEIAEILGNAEKWHSHGRGISMRELTSEEIKLKITDFGENPELNSVIRNYHGLCVDYYTKKSGVRGYIHSQMGLRRVI